MIVLFTQNLNTMIYAYILIVSIHYSDTYFNFDQYQFIPYL